MIFSWWHLHITSISIAKSSKDSCSPNWIILIATISPEGVLHPYKHTHANNVIKTQKKVDDENIKKSEEKNKNEGDWSKHVVI